MQTYPLHDVSDGGIEDDGHGDARLGVQLGRLIAYTSHDQDPQHTYTGQRQKGATGAKTHTEDSKNGHQIKAR